PSSRRRTAAGWSALQSPSGRSLRGSRWSSTTGRSAWAAESSTRPSRGKSRNRQRRLLCSRKANKEGFQKKKGDAAGGCRLFCAPPNRDQRLFHPEMVGNPDRLAVFGLD